MRSNFALRTLVLLAAWLVFENFNLHHEDEGLLIRVEVLKLGKSMESAGHPLLSILNPQRSTLNTELPPYRIKTIVLDAGHGGKDPGCIGASAHEKENCLAIVLRLGAYLEANYPEIKVIYTRDSDVFVELNERAAIANRNKADLFISVHCNSIPTKSVKGAETYVLGLHRSKDNLDVAKRENSSIYLEEDYQKNYEGYDPNSPEAEIFASVWQSAYLEQSILLASYVQQFANAVAFREDRGVKQAGFLVLRETAMPSVLIETGYLTNATEEEFLASEEGREQMALAIFQSFEAYKRHVETGQAVQNVATSPVKPAGTNVPAKQRNTVPAKTVAQKTTTTPTASKASADKAKTTTSKSAVGGKSSSPPVTSTKSYTIFLLSWPNRLDPNVGQLSLLANVKELAKEGKYHYYSGVYTSIAEAEKVLPEIQNMGFKAATIVQH